MFRTLVKRILKFQATLVMQKFHPRVVAVTGSVGKTSTKEAIGEVLSRRFHTRRNPKSYNSEFGVPLTILGLSSEWNSKIGWIKNILKGFRPLFSSDYPEILVLEMGVDRPGDLDYMVEIAHPFVGVVTAIGEVPVHVEYFSGPKALAYEKGKILRATAPEGFSILNFDDEVVYDMRHEARGTILTYGFSKEADITISQYRLTSVRKDGQDVPEGIVFKLDYKGSNVPVRLEGSFGKQQAYTVAAAVAVGLALGMHLVEAVESLGAYTAPPGRLKLVEGIKGSWILDDTYNASPMAMHAALNVLEEAPGKRKIAVLGDMLEIGKFTIQAHQMMGEIVGRFADAIFTVGPRAKFIAKEALERGMARTRVFEFSNSEEVGRAVQDFIEPGDLILVKGSQGVRMERITEEIMAHPEDAPRLLCRQEEYWKNKA
ncbi:MAG: hypothetical protein A3C84_02410 [Candidatus Ryanbacteria bacterium RIFCSPHIGHO2_02_FULL_48_12]|uniref:UDP-N-acetylmuramoyl-tripeptide--D-alanyl-D-alanine ligase n=1 Tax=Candidatus Ryanbacteria bacterium RIFCSPHIGHO2_01_FULL_48_27 TaxID=1802115 RepID=A0A1G2G6Q7_9BACT|nr:MAG: hypothetical protein A2756_02010 [Candidatus Ryanbacteria bacterium RIFCSPHIGHO2_01_FULL_48_27]OGZ50160.1 MAG: hypothetical protein A3C84_02410 [Candidatus Ryanbacteria bacterium RIFCSPHIGHO2_02_FULL_48_12]